MWPGSGPKKNLLTSAELHRIYIGQIEHGEKNISFGNLVKVSAVLGVTASELLSALEGGGGSASEPKRPGGRKDGESNRRANEIQKLMRRFKRQRAAMDQTMTALEELVAADSRAAIPSGAHSRKRPSAK